MLTVELERQPGEDMPRVTIRNVQSFSFLSNSSRLVLQIDVQHAGAVKAIADILLQAKGGRCAVLLSRRLQDGKVVQVRLARDFDVDAELAARVGAVPAIIHHAWKDRKRTR